jgi:hypothetical protein
MAGAVFFLWSQTADDSMQAFESVWIPMSLPKEHTDIASDSRLPTTSVDIFADFELVDSVGSNATDDIATECINTTGHSSQRQLGDSLIEQNSQKLSNNLPCVQPISTMESASGYNRFGEAGLCARIIASMCREGVIEYPKAMASFLVMQDGLSVVPLIALLNDAYVWRALSKQAPTRRDHDMISTVWTQTVVAASALPVYASSAAGRMQLVNTLVAAVHLRDSLSVFDWRAVFDQCLLSPLESVDVCIRVQHQLQSCQQAVNTNGGTTLRPGPNLNKVLRERIPSVTWNLNRVMVPVSRLGHGLESWTVELLSMQQTCVATFLGVGTDESFENHASGTIRGNHNAWDRVLQYAQMVGNDLNNAQKLSK